MLKPISFLGSAASDLRAVSRNVRRRLGFDLHRLQAGEEPMDWRPMGDIGPGVGELRARDETGAYRAFYVAKFPEAIYVLHCFEKKTQKTAQLDIELGRKRYKALIEARKP